LLNSSRPSEIDLRVGSLQLLVDEVLADAADSIKLKQVKVSSEIEEKPLLVLTDKDKLKIAFMNIIVNAIEAMEERSADRQIFIRIYHKEKYVITEITDNGCGMSQESLSRLFEPYYTSKRNGMGLGLASTMNIIQSHKGFIEVKSVEGRGTTFVVNLPIQN
jgi:signal transduction histidine kinase